MNENWLRGRDFAQTLDDKFVWLRGLDTAQTLTPTIRVPLYKYPPALYSPQPSAKQAPADQPAEQAVPPMAA